MLNNGYKSETYVTKVTEIKRFFFSCNKYRGLQLLMLVEASNNARGTQAPPHLSKETSLKCTFHSHSCCFIGCKVGVVLLGMLRAFMARGRRKKQEASPHKALTF